MGLRRHAHHACALISILLTTASFTCLALVAFAQYNSNNQAPLTSPGRSLYLFKADTSNFTAEPQSILNNIGNEIGDIGLQNDGFDLLTSTASSKDLKDFYLVGLWSYCEGDKSGGVEVITACSSPEIHFWFDPFSVLGLKNTSVQTILNSRLQTGLQKYGTYAKRVNDAYIVAVSSAGMSFLILGPLAWKFRFASFLAAILMTVVASATIFAAAGITIVYGALTAVLGTVLRPYNIEVSLGKLLLVPAWLGVFFSVASASSWSINIFI